MAKKDQHDIVSEIDTDADGQPEGFEVSPPDDVILAQHTPVEVPIATGVDTSGPPPALAVHSPAVLPPPVRQSVSQAAQRVNVTVPQQGPSGRTSVRLDLDSLPDPWNPDHAERVNALPQTSLPAGGLPELARTRVAPLFPLDQHGNVRNRAGLEEAVAVEKTRIWFVNRDKLRDPDSHLIGTTVRVPQD